MMEHEFQVAIDSASKIIESLPPDVQPHLMQIVQETIDRHKVIVEASNRSRKLADELEDVQANLSLTLTYVLFDLECVAREMKGG